MERVKGKIYAGAVLEQYVYTRKSGSSSVSLPKPRFKSDAERQRHRDGISQRKNARLINANFGPSSLYTTLTYDREHEVHTAEECRRERDNYFRRLRRKYPDARIYMVYGQGKSTRRFHLHMITEGIPEEDITGLWGRGEIASCDKLRSHCFYINDDGERVDHGRDYTALANYLFSHWQPRFGGHRWKASKNCVVPELEKVKPVKREYSLTKAPMPPKGYKLVEARSSGYGYLYYKYVLIPEPAHRHRLS